MAIIFEKKEKIAYITYHKKHIKWSKLGIYDLVYLMTNTRNFWKRVYIDLFLK